ncbi:DUF86 domain-containing protein [Patescibacteria group bacterium]|nr:DUF86 domain-containing protein [Patescibacteria group bacterium]MBU4480884.1 DUF86 domain-containing protein [Patescibacteria group bacterium]
MAKRSDELYLRDIFDSIVKIEKYLQNLNYDEFSENLMIVDAVVRNLEIIGEAAKNLSKEIKILHPEIPWKEMAGMRNKVIHEYFGVNLKIVWKTIKERLPELKTKIEEIFKNI